MMKLALLLLATITVWNGEKIARSESRWKELLGQERYDVMRKKGTERPFLGEYVLSEKEGTYLCFACDLPLFDSKDKYHLNNGWPSFTKPISPKNVYYLEDWSTGFKRYEVLCSRCDCHLGHVFNNGLKNDSSSIEKNLRYCINSIALKLR